MKGDYYIILFTTIVFDLSVEKNDEKMKKMKKEEKRNEE